MCVNFYSSHSQQSAARIIPSNEENARRAIFIFRRGQRVRRQYETESGIDFWSIFRKKTKFISIQSFLLFLFVFRCGMCAHRVTLKLAQCRRRSSFIVVGVHYINYRYKYFFLLNVKYKLFFTYAQSVIKYIMSRARELVRR